MKALTLWEPWATFIADGHKRYETRSWSTRFRGNLAIHASKRWDKEQDFMLRRLASEHGELRDYVNYEWHFGCVLVACRLVACHRVEAVRGQLSSLELALGDYSHGRFAWELEIVKHPPEPIPARGAQGLWNWEYQP
jgi:hypothetical protein